MIYPTLFTDGSSAFAMMIATVGIAYLVNKKLGCFIAGIAELLLNLPGVVVYIVFSLIAGVFKGVKEYAEELNDAGPKEKEYSFDDWADKHDDLFIDDDMKNLWKHEMKMQKIKDSLKKD